MPNMARYREAVADYRKDYERRSLERFHRTLLVKGLSVSKWEASFRDRMTISWAVNLQVCQVVDDRDFKIMLDRMKGVVQP